MQDDKKVFSPNILVGNADKYYVLVPLSVYRSIEQKFVEGGYYQTKDYYYFTNCVVKDTEDYYEDAHGNVILGNRGRIKFAFTGWNARIIIEDGAAVSETTIYMHTDAELTIGQKASIRECEITCDKKAKLTVGCKAKLGVCEIRCGKESNIKLGKKVGLYEVRIVTLKKARIKIGSKAIIIKSLLKTGLYAVLDIGKGCIFVERGRESHIVVNMKARASIGANTTVSGRADFEIGGNSELLVGKDSMFSYGIKLRTDDAHSIFDVKTMKNINSTDEIVKNRKVIIGNHVWVGMGAIILYHTIIGDGSIIGAGSLVKNRFPNNCVIAGNPARVIATDRCWTRKNGVESISECEEAYAQLTKRENFS